jgi:hypothetical protein
MEIASMATSSSNSAGVLSELLAVRLPLVVAGIAVGNADLTLDRKPSGKIGMLLTRYAAALLPTLAVFHRLNPCFHSRA